MMYNYDDLIEMKASKTKEIIFKNFKKKNKNKFMKIIENVISYFTCCKKKDKNLLKKEEKNKEKEADINNLNSESNLNIEMQPIKIQEKNEYHLNLERRKLYFIEAKHLDDKKLTAKDLNFVNMKFDENNELIELDKHFESIDDKELIRNFYLKKNIVNIKSIFKYVIFCICIIIAVVLNSTAPWNFYFRGMIDKNLIYKDTIYSMDSIGKYIF